MNYLYHWNVVTIEEGKVLHHVVTWGTFTPCMVVEVIMVNSQGQEYRLFGWCNNFNGDTGIAESLDEAKALAVQGVDLFMETVRAPSNLS